MARHRFEPDRFHNAIGAGEPVLRVADGDTIVATTVDAWGYDRSGRPEMQAAQSDDRSVLH